MYQLMDYNTLYTHSILSIHKISLCISLLITLITNRTKKMKSCTRLSLHSGNKKTRFQPTLNKTSCPSPTTHNIFETKNNKIKPFASLYNTKTQSSLYQN